MNGSVPINDRIAAGFGGGGHACAAGLHLKRDTAGFHSRLVAAMARPSASDACQPAFTLASTRDETSALSTHRFDTML